MSRRRGPNFCENEKLLCLNLIKSHKDIVESRKTDGVTVKQKEEAWIKIQTEFNTQSTYNTWRSKDSLKKLYECLKRQVKNREELSTKTQGVPLALMHDFDPVVNATMSVLKEEPEFDFHGMNNDQGEVLEENYSTAEAESILIEDDDTKIDIIEHCLQYPELNTSTGICCDDTSNVTTTKDITTPYQKEKEQHKLSNSSGRQNHSNKSSLTNKYEQHKLSNSSGRQNHSSKMSLTKKYENIADLKYEIAKFQLQELRAQKRRREEKEVMEYEEMKRRIHREEELYELKKRNLCLELEIKTAYLAKQNNVTQ